MIHRIPVRYRTARNFLMLDFTSYFTVIQLAAKAGQLRLVPKELLTVDNLFVRDGDGDTVFHFDAVNRCDLLEIASHLFLSENVLLHPNYSGFTVLHCVALGESLNRLPREYLTKDNLSLKDHHRWTIYHIAAAKSCLHQIPGELLTSDALLFGDVNGATPLDFAALEEDLNCVPITQELAGCFSRISKIIRDKVIGQKRDGPSDFSFHLFASTREWLAKIARLALVRETKGDNCGNIAVK